MEELILTAIINRLDVYGHSRGSVHIEQDGLVHRLKGYNDERAVFEYFCATPFMLNAHDDYETLERLTCVGCVAGEPWTIRG